MDLAHVSAGHWPEGITPSRFAAHVQRTMTTGCRVGLVGLPDDLGVRLNHGRPGAREGPGAFRAALARYGVASPQGFAWPRVLDVGDVQPAGGNDESALRETHARVSDVAEAIVRAGLFPVAIGGGHDLTYAFVRGVLRAHGVVKREASSRTRGGVGVVNFDAHLDVRDTAGSGMSFRRLLEEGLAQRVLIAGYNPLVNSAEHVSWFLEHGGVIADDDWTEHLEDEDLPDADAGEAAPEFSLLAPLEGAEMLAASFDLDVLDGSHAPGVSALHPAGINVREASRAVFRTASDPRLVCMDFMELCPTHDEQGRTARVAAHLFLTALMGLRLGPLLARGSGSR